MSKIFSNEIEKLYDRLASKKPFAFSKYADGEWLAMKSYNANPGDGEWKIDNSDSRYQEAIDRLIKSFKYKHDDYYVGISCPCCQGDKHYDMVNFSEQNDDNLTFANIFVNSNYKFYVDNFINYFSNHTKIFLVANKVTNLENLPFKVSKFYPIDYDAWILNNDLIDIIKEDIDGESGILFLFSCGPFGNILSQNLWDFNKENQYIDVGSTLDPWTKANRLKGKYYSGTSDLNKTCIWG